VTRAADIPVIYFPDSGKPVPFLMTGEEFLRFARMDGHADPAAQLKRLRQKGWLRGVKLGTDLMYTLVDALRCIDLAREADPR
jgi:hypothetical protein